jgi:hypothetical protein
MGSIVGTREDSGQARIVLDGSAPIACGPRQPAGHIAQYNRRCDTAPIWRIHDRHS